MAVGVSRSNAFPERLEAWHLRFDPAPVMISGTAFPEGPAIVPGGAQGFVSDNHGRAVLFPRSPIPAYRSDRGGLPVDDRHMAAAGLMGTVGRHRADFFAHEDLVEQFWQNGAVTIAAGGEFHRSDV